MATNSLTDRTDAAALIPEDAARDIIAATTESSALMRLARQLPNMSRKQQRLPVLSAFPTAYFVTGDTGLKQTTEAAWSNVYLNAEELAVIVPMPQTVIDDTDYDIAEQLKPYLVEAMGVAIDAAMLFSVNKPSTWPTGIRAAAVAAGNSVSLAAQADLYDALFSEAGTWGKVEADGYMVNGNIASVGMMSVMRGVRDSNGNPIFFPDPTVANTYRLLGTPVLFPKTGAFDTSSTDMFSGDWDQVVYSIRQDISYTVADQAVITDNAGNVVYNLFQQDMIALRVVMRVAFAVPNPINRLQQTEANRYPIAVLTT